MPKISISPQSTTQRRTIASSGLKSVSKHSGRDNIKIWEDKTLSGIFKITLKNTGEHGTTDMPLNYLSEVAADVKGDGNLPLLTTGILDQAIVEAASKFSEGKPFKYLLGCWKRVSRLIRAMKQPEGDDPRYGIVKEARRLCMSYCIFALTMPEIYGVDSSENNILVEHLLLDSDSDSGICHDFLSEAVSRFHEDDNIKEKLVESMVILSQRLARISMNDDYKPYVSVNQSSS